MPGIASHRLLVSLKRCPGHDPPVELQEICASTSQDGRRGAATHARAIYASVTRIREDIEQFFNSFASDDRRYDPDSVRRVLVSTNRMLALVTASHMAPASVASFLCRSTEGFT
jgi:hypothetical protein